MNKIDLTEEEKYLYDAIINARKIQNFLWENTILNGV